MSSSKCGCGALVGGGVHAEASLSEAELPFLVAQLSLLSGDGGGAPMDYAAAGGEGAGRGARERLLYGNLVSSPHLLRNLQGRRGVYFMFPDVAIRQQGRFQLKVTLIRLPRSVLPCLASRSRPGRADPGCARRAGSTTRRRWRSGIAGRSRRRRGRCRSTCSRAATTSPLVSGPSSSRPQRGAVSLRGRTQRRRP